ncbi:MAG: hypothetical protein F6J87_24825 [Spirulina sp. SIO3F2]|nr:hypothetical protein [Spirulina sp. SIO3F2]
MKQELQHLLYDLCLDWGFCIQPEDAEKIYRQTTLTADEFALAVVKFEGMNPEYDHKWVRKIAAKFRERFGNSKISKSTFAEHT